MHRESVMKRTRLKNKTTIWKWKSKIIKRQRKCWIRKIHNAKERLTSICQSIKSLPCRIRQLKDILRSFKLCFLGPQSQKLRKMLKQKSLNVRPKNSWMNNTFLLDNQSKKVSITKLLRLRNINQIEILLHLKQMSENTWKRKTNLLSKSNSCQQSERKWLVQLHKQWLKQEKPRKSLRLRNFLFLI